MAACRKNKIPLLAVYVIVSVVLTIISLLAKGSSPIAQANSAFGTLIYQWNGVNVFSNGNSYENTRPGTYGLEYQCVELVQRFYAQKWGYPNRWGGNAYQLFSTHPSDIIAIPNGGNPAPTAGDVIVFNRTDAWIYGHVAIVTAVSGGRVYFFEQNVGSRSNLNAKGWDSLPINSSNSISNSNAQFFNGRPPILGWLHSPRNGGGPAITPPILFAPTNGYTFSGGQRVVLRWQDVSGASGYEVSLWRSGVLFAGTSMLASVTSWDTGALPGGSYTWQVAAVASGGRSSSRIWGFTVGSPPSVSSAAFLSDVTYPDGSILSAGQSFNKTWQLKNTGTSTWNGFTLNFINGNQMGGPTSRAVGTTAPGQSVDITVPLVAPSSGGSYTGNWQLKDNQGVNINGGNVRVSIEVKTSTPPSPSGHITLFDVTPASPSNATSVHLVARVRYFPEFRSMRFVIGTDKVEMPNLRQIGDQLEISTDWNTASLARETYALAVEVATKSDLNWANPERRVTTYTLIGTPTPTGRPPDRPVLRSPYNWYLKDASGSDADVELCVNPSSDPDGDSVQYIFEVYLPQGSTSLYRSSGRIASNCWTSRFPPNVYSWRAKASDGTNDSDFSQDTWNFSVASGDVTIGNPVLFNPNTNDTHLCVPVAYGGIQAPDVYAWLNRAADGSDTGTWRLLDHYGPDAGPDCNNRLPDLPLAPVHGFWIRSPEYETGNHLIRISAFKRDSGASKTTTTNYNIAYIRPSDFQAIAPSTNQNNGTFWNTLTQIFQWTRPLRDDPGYQLRVSTSSDIWNDPAPLLQVTLPSGAISYTTTFVQDYTKLFWSVKAINSAGSADTGNGLWFGIDRIVPTAQVHTLPSVTYESVFQVNWSATDNSAGIRSYDIQYMDSSRGTWTDWLVGVPVSKTYDLFTGEPGHIYYFRSRATDNANNIGNYPVSADTFTKVDPAARPPTPWWNNAYSGKRNITILNNMPSTTMPAGYPVRLHFDSTTTPSAADLYNASQSTPKCNDLRVVYNDTTELDRLMESCSSSTIDIRFRTQTSISGGVSDNTSHQLYYGNPSSGAPPANQLNVWPPPNDGNTVGLWYLSEGAGSTSTDSSGRGNNITTIGSMNWCDGGKLAQALCTASVDVGPDGAFIPGNSSLSSNAFTFEAFVKRGSESYGNIAAQGESNNAQERWSFVLQEGKLSFGLWHPNGGGSVSTDSAALPDTNWHHLAATFDGDRTVRLYIDGALVKTGTMPNSGISNNNFDLYVGSGFKPYGGRNFLGTIDQARFSNVVRTSFPYAAIANITTEPSVATGAPISPPVTGSPDLVVLSLTTYPNPSGGYLIQAVIKNQGDRSTQNGSWIDLYSDHLPTGPGDIAGSIRYWVASPIEAGAIITVTTAITDIINTLSPSRMRPRTLAPASEVTSTLYVQVDSTGAVSETNKSNNISPGSQICVANADAFEGDDSTTSAKTITANGTPQTHNFHAPGDQDWVSFTATAGVTYTIATSSLGSSADTVLSLYAPDGTTLLASNDDYDNSLASQIIWTAPTDSTFYIKATNWNTLLGGCSSNYTLSVASPANANPDFYHYLHFPIVTKNFSGGW